MLIEYFFVLTERDDRIYNGNNCDMPIVVQKC